MSPDREQALISVEMDWEPGPSDQEFPEKEVRVQAEAAEAAGGWADFR